MSKNLSEQKKQHQRQQLIMIANQIATIVMDERGRASALRALKTHLPTFAVWEKGNKTTFQRDIEAALEKALKTQYKDPNIWGPQPKQESILEKIDDRINEGIMGKKVFKKIVDKIGDDTENNDSPKMRKFWNKWDKFVEGSGDLYVDEILWRIFSPSYGGKKAWERFAKEWTTMGYKI